MPGQNCIERSGPQDLLPGRTLPSAMLHPSCPHRAPQESGYNKRQTMPDRGPVDGAAPESSCGGLIISPSSTRVTSIGGSFVIGFGTTTTAGRLLSAKALVRIGVFTGGGKLAISVLLRAVLTALLDAGVT